MYHRIFGPFRFDLPPIPRYHRSVTEIDLLVQGASRLAAPLDATTVNLPN
jgi:hypothetical protein